TERVLENELIEYNAQEKHRAAFTLLWAKIQEQEYDENELYSFLEQLKGKLCTKLWGETHAKSLEIMTTNGLLETLDYMQDQLDKINTIMLDV
ncbi:hypothetical protein, partial [Klebsiella pneumoniae]|uniref:hypothetical protein n=1 Tax=Klebsiella pneumoniae TaxID=573 RepID=UPI003EE1C26A